MQEKIIPFGEEHPVKVISSDKNMITCHATDNNEGYILLGHGMEQLPKIGEIGKIVFEKGGPKGGYWQYYHNK